MSNGKIHAQTTQKNIIPITIAATIGAATITLAASGLVVGALLGHIVTPDYDINHPIYTQRRLIQKYWLLGWLWVIYWYPYRQAIAHRDKLSHSWPLGTSIRYLYLLGYPAYYLYTHLDPAYGSLLLLFYLCIFMGWSLQDWSHLRLDGFWPYKLRAKKQSRSHRRFKNSAIRVFASKLP